MPICFYGISRPIRTAPQKAHEAHEDCYVLEFVPYDDEDCFSNCSLISFFMDSSFYSLAHQSTP